MATITNLNRIKRSVESHLKAGDLELIIIPRAEYEALLEQIEDMKDIRDSIQTLKEYRSGKQISFDRYDARKKAKSI
jgi:hypothetical protein